MAHDIRWEVFWQRYRPFVLAIAQGRLRNEDDANDIATDVLVKCYYHYANFGRSDEDLRRLLAASTRNQIRTYLHRERGRQRRERESLERKSHGSSAVRRNGQMVLPGECVVFDPDPLMGQETTQSLRDALGKLPPRRELAMVLRHQNGLSLEEIAQQLGVCARTVTNELRQGCSDLKRILGQMQE